VAATLALVPLLAGCGVLGIATKSDLEKNRLEQERRAEELRGELRAVAADLDALQAALEPRLAKLEGDVDDLEEAAVRLEALDEALKSSRQQLAILEGRVSRDLREMEEDLATASAAGQRVADAYLADLQARRQDLRRQLEDLDRALTQWEAVEREARSSSSRTGDRNRAGNLP
jgi:chromosome segregation ATPase